MGAVGKDIGAQAGPALPQRQRRLGKCGKRDPGVGTARRQIDRQTCRKRCGARITRPPHPAAGEGRNHLRRLAPAEGVFQRQAGALAEPGQRQGPPRGLCPQRRDDPRQPRSDCASSARVASVN